MSCPFDGQLKATTAMSASATCEAASHSQLKAARVMASEKVLSNPWTKTRRLRPALDMSPIASS